MANGTHPTDCPPPFLNAANFPYSGGYEQGRLCSQFPGGPQCCLPCPLTNWVYPDNFSRLTSVANWLNVGSILCCVILLLTLLILPKEKTSRHYLTVCLITAVGIMSLAFMVPLGSRPNECHDSITPNDIHSDLSCAFSGSFVTYGGFGAVMWVFLRSLSLHLQICWQIKLGRKFFLGALLAGWGIPAISLALVLTLTGMSYRFGTTCHTNHNNSVATFWGPLLAFAGACCVLQFATLAYCIRVYIRSLLNPEETSQTSSNLPSYHGSVRTVSAVAAYRRVRQVIAMQWRGIVIVLIIVINVVYFAVIFIQMDNATTAATQNLDTELAWVLCLWKSGGDKDTCLPYTKYFVMNEATVIAVLYLLSLNGYWSILFLGKLSMITGWIDIIKSPFNRSHEFVSVDARRISDPRRYEMLKSPSQAVYLPKSVDDLESSPDVEQHSPRDFEPTAQQGGYYGREAAWRSPSMSFSSPKPPQISATEEPQTSPSPKRYQETSAWETDSKASSAITERAEVLPSNPPRSVSAMSRERLAMGWERSGSALGGDRSGSALGGDRSGSALGGERSGSALGRGGDSKSIYQKKPGTTRATPTPLTSSAALGRDWDPRSTFARGGDSALGVQWKSAHPYARGREDGAR